jgi:hypothetical protein
MSNGSKAIDYQLIKAIGPTELTADPMLFESEGGPTQILFKLWEGGL